MKKYSMLLGEEVPDFGPDWWIIYPTTGNYIHDEVARLPGGSKYLQKQARQTLDAMNAGAA